MTIELERALFLALAEQSSLSLPKWCEAQGISYEVGEKVFDTIQAQGGFYTREGEWIDRISPYTPLNQEAISTRLQACEIPVVVEVLFDTDSTNKAVLAVDPLDSAALCVAEKQSSGRGRQGREWSSPLGRSLYFSLRYPFKLDDYARLSPLSLQVGMDLVEVLRAFGIDANLKWPNDIWVQGEKLAGILLETFPREGSVMVVIGIGLNNHTMRETLSASYNATSCETLLGTPLDRNSMAALLAQKLYESCERIAQGESLRIDERWPDYSALLNTRVKVISGDSVIYGQELGVDGDGALQFMDEDGKLHSIYSGELSLRPAE